MELTAVLEAAEAGAPTPTNAAPQEEAITESEAPRRRILDPTPEDKVEELLRRIDGGELFTLDDLYGVFYERIQDFCQEIKDLWKGFGELPEYDDPSQ